WLAILLGAAGLLLILLPHGDLFASGVGAFFGVASGASWAAGTVVTKWASRRAMIDPLSTVAWQTIVGTVALGIAALLVREPPMQWTLPLVLVFAYTTLLAAIVAWTIWFFLLQRLSAVTTAMSALAVPVIGLVTAYVQLGERPAPVQWLGIVLILAALAVITTANAFRNERNSAAGSAT
ncbi:MAG: DMT family transporter, partial [Candidatus Eremiobacteraeota bacterium]|nr:DMT family transporter [Candidatus Eremiobacteraeota bacterium]